MTRASQFRPFLRILCLAVCLLNAMPLQAAKADTDPLPVRTELNKQIQLIDDYTLNLADLNALYQIREYKQAWRTKGEEDRAALSNFVDTMEAFAAYHGVQDDHEPAQILRKMLAKTNEDNAIKLELLITDWLIKIAHDLYGDHVNLSQLYVGWDFKRPHHQIIPEMAASIQDNKINEYFTTLLPTLRDYDQLAEALKTYRAMKSKGPWPTVTAGPTIKPQNHDARLEQVRARLQAEGYDAPPATPSDPTLYADDLKAVVIAYQSRNGLEADGNIGAKTIIAMNISLIHRIEQIIANMERLRHMPRSYPSRYAMVNIASASVKVFDNNTVIYHEPVVIGRTDRKTPFIESAIRSVIFNPSWHVPAKIAREDILPKLRKDPHYLEKLGFVINSQDDEAAGTTVDWNTVKKNEFAFRLRQAPGELNSLGRIKFDFDNNFSVYMHGTPHEELFARAARNLSSGCIRLKDPESFAVIVLRDNEGNWGADKVQSEIDKNKTHWLKVEHQLPLYVIYQTAFFDSPDGPINFRTDAYNYDRILIDALRQKDD